MSGKSFEQMEAECVQESTLWGEQTIKDLYKEIATSKSCGAFCHR